MTYIIFSIPPPTSDNGKYSTFWNLIGRALSFILPKGNPDFSDKIDDISLWLLEFVDEHSAPNREIGINVDGVVIVKMPYKKNYGYWTDNNLILPDFRKHFEVREVSKEYFEELWESFN